MQKWVMVLLLCLVVYDDPLYVLKTYLPVALYEIGKAVTDATFISLMLFFWTVVFHSIAQVSIFS